MSLSSSFQPCQDPHKKLSFSLITLVTRKKIHIDASYYENHKILHFSRFLKKEVYSHKIMEIIDSLDEKIVKKAIVDSLKKLMQQSVVSIYGPLGYGPSTLPLRHSALLLQNANKTKTDFEGRRSARVNLIAKA